MTVTQQPVRTLIRATAFGQQVRTRAIIDGHCICEKQFLDQDVHDAACPIHGIATLAQQART